MPCERKGDLAERIEHTEHVIGGARALVAVAHVGVSAVGQASRPCYG